MSQLFQKRVSLFKDVTASQLHTPLRYCGTLLTLQQERTTRACYAQWLAVVMEILSDGDPDHLVDIFAWYRKIHSVDIYDLSCVLKRSISFLRHIDEENYTSYCRFKHDIRDIGCDSLGILDPVLSWIGELCDSPNTVLFAHVNLFLSFPTRLNIGLDFSDQMTSEYLANEERLGALDFSSVSEIKVLNKIMREWLTPFRIDEFYPSHGGGAVAALRGKALGKKYEDLALDVRSSYLMNQLGIPPANILLDADKQLRRISEVIIVPKSLTAGRMISKEPATLQYLQHGVLDSLDHYISHHHVLRKHISLHDQEALNQNMCLKGSSNPSLYGTIDLSAASDSVSWRLVKQLFAGTPLLMYLYTTKSDFAELNPDLTVRCEKFAPMGSALCFPIETLIFACLCEYVARFSGIRFKDNSYCVYGDDIVVDLRLVDHLIDLLEKVGFAVNTEKSFYSPLNTFRESCGIECYRGADVSPLRISRKFAHGNLIHSPELFEAYVAASNAAYLRDLKMLRYWYIQQLLALPRHFQHVFSNEENGLWSSHYTNFHLKSVVRFRDPYLKCGGLHTVVNQIEEYSEDIRLFEWLRSTARRRTPVIWPGDACTSEIRSSRTVLRSRHVSKP